MAEQTQNLTFSSGGVQLKGYLARPEGDGPFPGVVIIHEIFGLNDNIRDIARRFAAEGYLALAVDLFAGRNRVICMLRIIGDLFFKSADKSSGVRDLKAGIDLLAEQEGVDKARLGAIGFCMGGSYAIALGCSDNRIKVIAPYYGMNPRQYDEAVKRTCPVVASYPNKDFTTKPGQKLVAALEQYNIPHDVKVYEAKHSFFNDTGPNYNEAAAKDSWQRVMDFFQQYVGQPVNK